MLNRMIEWMLNLSITDSVISRAETLHGPSSIFRRILDTVDIRIEVPAGDLTRIPRTGPLIVVANHPTGFAEGLAVPAFLDSVRPDVLVMGHSFFSRWPELASRMIIVNPQATDAQKKSNVSSLRESARALREGKCLVIFPAGEVARPQSRFLSPEELPWRSGLAQLLRLTDASILPVHVSGQTGWGHRFLSRIHPRLGALRLCREFLGQKGGAVRFKIGQPIFPDEFRNAGTAAEAVAMCRSRVLELGLTEKEERHEFNEVLFQGVE